MQSADNGMFHAARPRWLYLQVQADLALAAESQNLFDGGNALAGKRRRFVAGGPEPTPGIELAQLFEAPRGDRAAAAGGSLERIVVKSHQTRIAREMQVGLDEASAPLDRLAKSRHGILGRSPRRSPMRDHPHV